jgi:hypothetical protein
MAEPEHPGREPSKPERALGVLTLASGAAALLLHHYGPRIGIRFHKADDLIVPAATGMIFAGLYGSIVGLEPGGDGIFDPMIKLRPVVVLLFACGVVLGYFASR